MTIQDLVDSNLSTELLESMYKSTTSQVKFLQTLTQIEEKLDMEQPIPKELIGWQRKLSAVISIRKAIEPQGVTEKQDRDFDLERKYGNPKYQD